MGELLQRKASEGVSISKTIKCNCFSQVRVLVMTWNEKSNDTGLLEGMMGTHDEETLNYFRGTDVICTNVQRAKDSWLGLGGQFVSTLYTRVFQNAQKSKDLRGRLAKYVVIHN